MKEVRFLGEVVTLSGEFPEVGKKAPNFMLTNVELNELQMKSFEGEKIVLAISPSIDTPVCQESVSKFNELASKFPNVNMVCVSADLPFALERFGKERKLNDVIMASFFRTAD
ncbi:redoxin domain-containing protein, partial [Vibrio anguillarum]|nr:redoxin domain-containing protein [Vibrio anguillarum]